MGIWCRYNLDLCCFLHHSNTQFILDTPYILSIFQLNIASQTVTFSFLSILELLSNAPMSSCRDMLIKMRRYWVKMPFYIYKLLRRSLFKNRPQRNTKRKFMINLGAIYMSRVSPDNRILLWLGWLNVWLGSYCDFKTRV